VKPYTLDGTGIILPELLDTIGNSEGVFCGMEPNKLSGGGGGGGGCVCGGGGGGGGCACVRSGGGGGAACTQLY
jgi:hypothetical protein